MSEAIGGGYGGRVGALWAMRAIRWLCGGHEGYVGCMGAVWWR